MPAELKSNISDSARIKEWLPDDDDDEELLIPEETYRFPLHEAYPIKFNANLCSIKTEHRKFEKNTQFLTSNYCGEPPVGLHPWLPVDTTDDSKCIMQTLSKEDKGCNHSIGSKEDENRIMSLPDPALVEPGPSIQSESKTAQDDNDGYHKAAGDEVDRCLGSKDSDTTSGYGKISIRKRQEK